MHTRDLYIGLMSGTSIDSIDAALVDFGGAAPQLLAQHNHPISAQLKQQILSLCQPGDNELDRMGELDRALGAHFADAALAVLRQSNYQADQIRAIGSHGQTVRHRPPGTREWPFTLQIGDPNTIAERTGITTVADFRRRDIAANGQGAPLAPAFHQAVFHSTVNERFVVNIGGMANVTHLPTQGQAIGFDTGPGNVLMDAWIGRHLGHEFDRDGEWAAQGHSIAPLVSRLLDHPFFRQAPPKSTGRETFHLDWLLESLQDQPPIDVQASLLELSARSIADCIQPLSQTTASEIYLCGGGAYNRQLLVRLQQLLPQHRVETTMALGLAPEWVEAAAFAWLARQTQGRLSGNLPAVTGADKPVILGGVYVA